jgi:hypothetical protein
MVIRGMAMSDFLVEWCRLQGLDKMRCLHLCLVAESACETPSESEQINCGSRDEVKA